MKYFLFNFFMGVNVLGRSRREGHEGRAGQEHHPGKTGSQGSPRGKGEEKTCLLVLFKFKCIYEKFLRANPASSAPSVTPVAPARTGSQGGRGQRGRRETQAGAESGYVAYIFWGVAKYNYKKNHFLGSQRPQRWNQAWLQREGRSSWNAR